MWPWRSKPAEGVSTDAVLADAFGDDAEPASLAIAPVSAVRESLVSAIVTGIRSVSADKDRADVVEWFANAHGILSSGKPKPQVAGDLYRSIDTRRTAGIIANTLATSVKNYASCDLPLALRVAIPVTIGSLPFVGLKGAGIVAAGNAIGLPVVLLLFLGSAGAASVVEAFVRDPAVRDPLAKLLIAIAAADAKRRLDKDLAAAMRAEAQVPRRADVPAEHAEIAAFLGQMDPIDFERHVMTFFEGDGHPVGVTSRSNDCGIDGYVLHPDGPILVQCKRYSEGNTVGRPAVQQFWGTLEQKKALRGYFVTTSAFTREAVEAAAENPKMVLVDGPRLVEWHVSGRRDG